MNYWNLLKAPAYNLKVYNVIPQKYRQKVYELMEAEDFYYPINELINSFDYDHKYLYQAGFNGRSGGYLVLYKSSVEYKRIFTFKDCNEYQTRDYADGYGWKTIAEAKKQGLYNKEIANIKTSCAGIEDSEVDQDILTDFEKLAIDIVNCTIFQAKNFKIETESYTVKKTRKILIEK